MGNDPYLTGLTPDTSIDGSEIMETLDSSGKHGTALSELNKFCLRNRGIRTVIIGDSYSQLAWNIDRTVAGTNGPATFNFDSASGASWYSGGRNVNTADYGAFTWADALMGAPHYILKNSGVGGNNTDQILARFDADCISLRPELVYLWAGRNDLAQGKTADYVIANWKIMLGKLEAIGAMVCALDCPPGTPLSATYPGAAREAVKFNAWLRDEARRRPALVVVSVYGAMVDPDVANAGAAKTSMVLSDLTHTNNLGAFILGKRIAAAMSQFIKRWDNFPSSPVNGWDYSPTDDSEIRSSNPLFAGTAGTISTGITGTVATGYDVARLSGSPNVVASIVPDRDGIGNAQRLAITFAAAGDAVQIGTLGANNITPRWVAGKIMEGQCDVAFSSDSAAVVNRLEFIISGTFNGASYSTRALSQVVSSDDQALASNVQPLPLAGIVLRPRTPRVMMPGPCTTLQHLFRIYAAAAGTVTIDLSRWAGPRQFAIG